MSGHSHWAQIKRQKSSVDAKRGALFSKLAREIIVAVKQGGPNPDANLRLRMAIERAREGGMPNDGIQRAITRGSGPGAEAQMEEVSYEGYGPGGAAVLVEAATDNRNRTAAEVRTAFTRGGGNLGEAGCVAWMFNPRGMISLKLDGRDSDEAMLAAIEAGAEDVVQDSGELDVTTSATNLDEVRQTLAGQGYQLANAELTMQPSSTLEVSVEDGRKLLRLLERLDELEDVQRVYTNADFPAEVLAEA